MPRQIVKRRSRGFICVNAHPEGCRLNVAHQIAAITQKPVASATRPPLPDDTVPHNVLVIGASTGYGLASRITAAWGYDARTLGVFFERPPDENKTATAGYYNTVAFDAFAKRDGLFAAHLNADAFSDECKREALDIIRRELAPIDLVIYSVASPKRTDPRTGLYTTPRSSPLVSRIPAAPSSSIPKKWWTLPCRPASEKEIADTIAVMGGEDWRLWIEALAVEGLLAPGIRTVAYSYIGPELTWPIYRDGTIGRAKHDLDQTAARSTACLRPNSRAARSSP